MRFSHILAKVFTWREGMFPRGYALITSISYDLTTRQVTVRKGVRFIILQAGNTKLDASKECHCERTSLKLGIAELCKIMKRTLRKGISPQLTIQTLLVSQKLLAMPKRFHPMPDYQAPQTGLENRESSHRSGKPSRRRLPLSSVSHMLQHHRARDHTLHR